MGIVQIIVIVLFSLSFVENASKHGKNKDYGLDKYNVLQSAFKILIWTLLLLWGGFWD